MGDQRTGPTGLAASDKAILDVLKRGRDGNEPWGRATKGYLIKETAFTRNSIYYRLEKLTERGYVRVIHAPTRLYEFVHDPRDTQ